MAAKGAGKPKLNMVKAATPPSAKFDLGTRPESLRGTAPPRIKPAAPSTRDYGKGLSATQPAPPVTMQPGQPMGGAPLARGGKVGW